MSESEPKFNITCNRLNLEVRLNIRLIFKVYFFNFI